MNNKNENIKFNLDNLNKVEDIIFLDEPILSHLKRDNKHFLFYLVDTLKEVDIYLLFEVSEKSIFDYLTKEISLRSLIVNNKNFFHIIKQDFNGKILDVSVTESEFLDKDYLPNSKSFLTYEPSEQSYYYNFIKEYNSNFYLKKLQEKAFYIKFAPNTSKYSSTIGFNELASNLLSNISKSYKSFLKADFYKSFEKINSDKTKLTTIINKLLPDLDFRMVDLKYGSFEIGLAVDTVMKNSITDKYLKEWAIDVGYKYKSLVLDDDYDKKTVSKILDNYNEEDRKNIFSPIFKITENPNYNFQIKNSKSSKYSTIRIKDKTTIEKIIPKKIENLETDNKEFEIIQFTTVRDKNKKQKTIKLENTLFNLTDTTEVVLTNKDFEKFGYNLDFEIKIPLKIITDKNIIILNAMFNDTTFEVKYGSDKIDDGIKKITDRIYEYILEKM